VVGRRRRRGLGARFGTLVHAVLAGIALDADAATVARATELHTRLLGATDEERDTAITSVADALAHPLLRRAAAAARQGRCRREVAIVLPLDDGVLVEGVADLVFAEDGRWTVVDFKTDVEIGERLPEYRRQVALYVRAVGAATSDAVRGVLLRV